MVIDACASDGTTRHGISGRRDFVGLQREVGNIVTASVGRENIGRRRGNCGTIFGPIGESVTYSRCSNQGDFLTMGVGAAT